MNSTPGPSDEELLRQIAALQAQLAQRQTGTQFHAPVTAQRDVIGRDAIKIIHQHFTSGEGAKDAELALTQYLHVLGTALTGLRLGEIDGASDKLNKTALLLPDIYVPLNTTLLIPKKLSLPQALAAHSRKAELREEELRFATALEALAAFPQLTLIGEAGSGKSSFGAFVLLTLVRNWQSNEVVLDDLGPEWRYGKLLPVRVVLRQFAEAFAAKAQPLTAGDLWQFMGDSLQKEGWGHGDKGVSFLQRLVRQHGALVLFDGLDECGNKDRCDSVLAAVQQFMVNEGLHSRFVLTARPYAFPEADAQQGRFMLAEFDDEQIAQFIASWYAAIERRGWCEAAEAASKCADLQHAWQRPDLLPLARNPLRLTLMAMLHSTRGRLPDDRVQLYEETVDLLLQRWNHSVGAEQNLLAELQVPNLKLSDFKSVLESLAFQVHAANVGKEGVADISEGQLIRAFEPLLLGSKDKATRAMEFIERRAGLLVGQGGRPGDEERRFTFPHRTFQEFLAARHLSTRTNFPQQCRQLATTQASHWRIVLQMAARLADSARGASAADELIGSVDVATARNRSALTPADWMRALLAAEQLQEIGVNKLAAGLTETEVLNRVRSWLLAGLPLHPDQGGLPATQRAQMGEVLSALGDPRFDAAKHFLPADDMLGFVHVPADPAFCIGTRKADAQRVADILESEIDEDEINDEVTPTAAFYTARYPVTRAQYAAFLRANGRDGTAPNVPAALAPHPCTDVTWADAVAYCEWLQQQLATAPAFDGDAIANLVRQHRWRVMLPSEVEWEKAARGKRKNAVFTWGEQPDPQRANYNDSGVDSTSAVGGFQPNDLGLYDMLGNVWEWTRSEVKDYPYPRDGKCESMNAASTENRVVRGGSWLFTAYHARCAFRYRYEPDDRRDLLGFRVVLCSAPV
jgi:formylglycine-generating enzyme required for sulfatase activity